MVKRIWARKTITASSRCVITALGILFYYLKSRVKITLLLVLYCGKFSKFIAEEVFSFGSATFANDSMFGHYKWQVTSFFIFKGFLLISWWQLHLTCSRDNFSHLQCLVFSLTNFQCLTIHPLTFSELV